MMRALNVACHHALFLHGAFADALPAAEPLVLAGATHLLHLQNPAGMAAGLAGFFGRHPLPAAEEAGGTR
jgi:hypothetical protein